MHPYAAIDPLALIFTGAVYQRLIEKLHPHVPVDQSVAEIVKGMSHEERLFTAANAKRLADYASVVQQAVGNAGR